MPTVASRACEKSPPALRRGLNLSGLIALTFFCVAGGAYGLEDAIGASERSAPAVRAVMLATLGAEPRCSPDYADVVDPIDFQPVERIRGTVVLPVAARIGATRLIDNFHLTVAA